MNEKVYLSDLIVKARKVAVESFGYKQSTMRHYERHWKNLNNYFNSHGYEIFSDLLAEQYVFNKKQQRNNGKMAFSTFRTIRRAVYLLKDCYANENITWNRFENRSIMKLVEPAFVQLHECYAHQLQNEQKSVGTIRAYSQISECFLEYLEMKRYKDISEVTPKDVNTFILHISNRFPKGMHVLLPGLRSFFRFLESMDKTTASLIWAVPGDPHRRTSIVSGVIYDETQKLLATMNRNNNLGKRDYAILLLATRTGLRQTDISNLRLTDIKWRIGTIELVQKKTNSLLILPLLVDVGNAIVDYILNARPKADSPYLFLRNCAPFTKIDGAACYRISSQAMEKAGVHQKEGERKGMHCLRHAVATRLLEKETPLSVISTILGHKTKDSTKIYLSTDIRNLKFCALGLDEIEVDKEEHQYRKLLGGSIGSKKYKKKH